MGVVALCKAVFDQVIPVFDLGGELEIAAVDMYGFESINAARIQEIAAPGSKDFAFYGVQVRGCFELVFV